MEATFTHVVNPVMCMILPKSRVLSPWFEVLRVARFVASSSISVKLRRFCSLLREEITMTAMLHDLEVSCWVWRVDCRRGWKYATGRCLDELTKQHIGNMAGSHERYDIYYFVDMFYPVFFSACYWANSFYTVVWNNQSKSSYKQISVLCWLNKQKKAIKSRN